MTWAAFIVLALLLLTIRHKHWGGYVIDALAVLGIVAVVALHLWSSGALCMVRP